MHTDLSQWQQSEQIQAALSAQRIAVVGLSNNPARDSHRVAAYMLEQGYDITPVNPNESSIFGRPSYPNLAAIEHPIEMVNVFRDPSAVPGIVAETIALGAEFLWLQLGVIHAEGIETASRAGITCIVDRCLMVEHARLG